ncbi:MAG TPA: Gfo/Idh/MocA family oxidoreductase [Actinomycetes bacterium]
MSTPVRIGVVGGGLMGKELLALTRRWDALLDHPARPEVVALADPAAAVQQWWREAGVATVTDDYRRLLDGPSIDVVYLAVPHDQHERLYLDTVAAGKDFLGEKPFGIDLASAERIVSAVDASSAFVRVSSELPFFPGAQRAVELVRDGLLGEVLEVRSGLLHSSDLDRAKPINWKRRAATCGEIGVMGDLGMHAAHVPLRLGWEPHTVFALLDDVVRTRPGPDGRPVPCDTFDNATLALTVETPGRRFPMLWETKRIAPGQRNTWFFEALGMDGGVRFSTRSPQVLQRFGILDGEQAWSEVQPGHRSVWPTVTGGIFEFGFPDALLQMWATFLAERAGLLGDRFSTATPHEALAAHRVFAAALRSHETGRSERVAG